MKMYIPKLLNAEKRNDIHIQQYLNGACTHVTYAINGVHEVSESHKFHIPSVDI